VALLLSIEKTVVEGAGATGLAALLAHRERFAGKRVATILTGGNIDLRVLASVAMRELVRSGRLLRLTVAISDSPGVLARLAGVIGEAGANIVDVAHDRLSLALNPKGASIEVVVEVQDAGHGEALRDRLAAHGFAAVIRASAS
jgi:threonine dehydratase